MRTVITCGDINGIGPEIAIRAVQELWNKKKRGVYSLIIPQNVFTQTYHSLGCNFPFTGFDMNRRSNACVVELAALKDSKVETGKPTKQSGKAALTALEKAREILFRDQNSLLVTAPISKDACVMAGSEFHGHTEMLAAWAKTSHFMMLFVSRAMRGGLLTIHEPLKNVSRLLTKKLIESKLQVALDSLRRDFNVAQPQVALLGLNPHAGENGLLGNEENRLFNTIIAKYKLHGPFPADAFFATKRYKDFDFVLSPYHDQLLIPFKMLSWRDGVNFTAGLPFVRTSPDHGVAYDLAGTGKADIGSILAAVKLGEKILNNRMKYVVKT